MTPRQRGLLALIALVVVIVAFVALRPGDDDNPVTTSIAAAVTTTAPAATATTPDAPATTATTPATTATTPAAPARPQVVTVRAVGLKPVGGIRSISVNKGDTVRFDVTSDTPESVHLHGYDVEKPVAPGSPARYRFTANIEGIFEVELEGAGVQLIRLRVDP
jgi:FtsP/CotA-like multicopper oxidase with cupredoxin domain